MDSSCKPIDYRLFLGFEAPGTCGQVGRISQLQAHLFAQLVAKTQRTGNF